MYDFLKARIFSSVHLKINIMCKVCEFYEKLETASKADPALNPDGMRTIHGYYNAGDASILGKYYPLVGEENIQQVAKLINHPRLLEVAGIVELVERYLEKSFSNLRDVAINVVSNPLSILFLSPKEEDGVVHRIKTPESELLHGAMEKMALRRGSLDKINSLLDRLFGATLTYGCSCCGIIVATKDIPALYNSDYYQKREGFGRLWDSDVLTATNGLFSGVSVSEIPDWVLDRSADFGKEEVKSYIRFATAAQTTVTENSVKPDLSDLHQEVLQFLTGQKTVTCPA
jgi:hypothetical protein